MKPFFGRCYTVTKHDPESRCLAEKYSPRTANTAIKQLPTALPISATNTLSNKAFSPVKSEFLRGSLLVRFLVERGHTHGYLEIAGRVNDLSIVTILGKINRTNNLHHKMIQVEKKDRHTREVKKKET